MTRTAYLKLSRRERQIMDILFRRGTATAADIRHEMSNPPTNSAVRAKLRVLEEKGCIEHESDGHRYVYRPTLEKERVRRNVVRHIVDTFFAGSVELGVATMLRDREGEIRREEVDRLARLVDSYRSEMNKDTDADSGS